MNNGNNFYTGVAPEPTLDQGDVSSQMDTGEQEGNKAKQTATLPDPMTKIDPLLSEVFALMVEIRNMIEQTSHNPTVNNDKIQAILSDIDEINKNVLDLPKSFATISL